jgi:3-methyl-2-oxobutanoate hydroxymethyltransferase
MVEKSRNPKSVHDLFYMRDAGNRLAWITAYDYPSAYCAEKAGVDMVLVGDSGAMVQYGMKRTSGISMNLMIEMAKAVRIGAPETLVVGDMPRGTYEIRPEDAVENALSFAIEGGCDLVKLEGASDSILRSVKAITDAGIPVIGHLGLTPQSLGMVENYHVVAKQEHEMVDLKRAVDELIHAGVSGILLEAIPPNVSAALQKKSEVPLYGIGAGPELDGQLLIYHDIIGYFPSFRPKFARHFISEILPEYHHSPDSQDSKDFMEGGIGELIQLCIKKYVSEVKAGRFPTEQYFYKSLDQALVNRVFK